MKYLHRKWTCEEITVEYMHLTLVNFQEKLAFGGYFEKHEKNTFGFENTCFCIAYA